MKLNTAAVSILLATVLLPHQSALAFTPSSSSSRVTIRTSNTAQIVLNQASSNEESLRDEIKQKSTLVDAKDEIQYGAGVSGLPGVETDKDAAAATDATATAVVEDDESSTTEATTKDSTVPAVATIETTSSTSSSAQQSSIDQKKLERILKPRSYPLFLAEKAALITEDIYDSVFSANKKDKEMSPYELYQQKQELEQLIKDGNVDVNVDVNSIGISKKEKIVILGTGWGSAAFLKSIDTSMYDVTVISPRNFFLFTPMLAGASVGTVEYRSITESIREINRKANFLEGTATYIDPNTKTISCESVVCEGNSCSIEDFTVSYDRLIVTVGAQTNTFGIPGVREHCCFLKQVEDARRIRTAIVNCFERANLPTLDEEAKKNVLTFAVIGAGPTGVEFASELRDFIEQDGPKYYPDLIKFVRIKVIEASPTVLAPFDKSLQEEAIKQLTRGIDSTSSSRGDESLLALLPPKFKLTELLLNSGVSEVKEDSISLNDGTEIPYGLAVWAAGNGPLPITLQLIDSLGSSDGSSSQAEGQSIARGRLAVDAWLRVLDGDGSIFSYGDCSCITTGQLPATAQVASQQGEYLARLFSLNYDMNPGLDSIDGSTMTIPPKQDNSREKKFAEKISSFAIQDDETAAPFQFLNLGILAYTGGGSALAQLQLTPAEQARVKGKGKIGFSLWRSVYLSKQVSFRNVCLISLDWLKTRIFGRDITSFD